MSTSRVLTSTLRAVSRRAAPAQRQLVMRSTARRGYSSSSHGGSAGAEKTSDLPWLITSVAITVPAAAWLLSSGPDKKAHSHDSSSSSSSSSHHSAPVPDEEKSPAVESSSSESSSDNNPPTNQQQPQEGNPTTAAAHQSGETGKRVPPPSADNSDMATDYEDKKDEAQEQYKDMIRDKDTRVATSSSDVPSKKTAAEHPREDPQKGEGEGVKKGGPE
ncbi:hypothetical protein M434DRAFT_400185 [Hypoxylon sp. CO27-5]|nr:hypothetical protein M434DRAFT_400185 [Hypoxylon sp. CO27-5]